MITPKYSFITWSTTAPDAEDCQYALPAMNDFGVAFLVKDINIQAGIYYRALNGDLLYTAVTPEMDDLGKWVWLKDNPALIPLEKNQCFYLEISDAADEKYYSNLFIYIGVSEQATPLMYYSQTKEDVYDFNYSQVDRVEPAFNFLYLPFIIKNPQFPQDMKVYKALDGTRKMLFSTVEREFELETDAMTEEMHAKMVIALSHDKVRIM